MKNISISILFICAMAASFSNWLLIGSFTLNQRYIASELCVNRYKPGSNCNGHCYLKKQLQKQEKPEASNNREKFSVQLFFAESTALVSAGYNLLQTKYSTCQQFAPQCYLKSFFHPPSA
jgi:hypothetical protein